MSAMPVSLTKRTGRATLAAMAVPAAVPSTGLHTGLRADHARLVGRLEELAAVGDTGDGGCCRLALTDEDRRGRDLVVAWMEDLDLAVSVDAIGNVVGLWDVGDGRPGDDRLAHRHRPHGWPVRRQLRRAGRARGGRDAQAGRAWSRRGRWRSPSSRTRRAPATPPTCWGRWCSWAGMALEEALDVQGIDGSRLGDELERIGYAGPLPCPSLTPHAFVELHIEQGPVLEAEGITIGAVTGRAGHLVAGADHHRPVQPRRHHAHGPPPRPGLRGRRADRRGAPPRARAGRPPGRHRGPLPGAPRPGQRGAGGGHAHGRPAQHRRVGAAGRRAAAGRAGRRAGRRRGGHRLRPEPGPLRAGGVRRQGDRPGRGDGAAARPLRAPHALGRRPRRPDAGPGVPDRHGVRPQREGHQPQPGRAHRPGAARRGRRRAAARAARPGRWRAGRAAPAPGDGAGRHEPHRGDRRRPDGPGAARPHPQGRGRAARRPAPPGRRRPAASSWCTPSWRSPPSSPAGSSRTSPRSTSTTSGPCRGPTPSRCSTRPSASGSVSAWATPSSPPMAIGTTRRSWWSGTAGSRPATARSTSPATSTTSPIGRSSTPSATTSSPGRTSPACGRPSAGGWG